jgi:signal transduction histidine kinase
MLHEFLASHRETLIERCRTKVAQRAPPETTRSELTHGIPLFLEQLIQTLRLEQESSQGSGGPASGQQGPAALSELAIAATRHGRELLEGGYTVEQVVHDYGDLCQAVTELAGELAEPITVNEFHTLNRCLDDGIAEAVTAFTLQRETVIADRGVQALNERLGMLAHEVRNHLNTAMLAVAAIRTGSVGMRGATGTVLDQSLIGLRNLVDRSLAEVRATAGLPARHELVSLAELMAEVKLSASLEANGYACKFTVASVDPVLALDVDRDMLLAAVGNLLQNAFKFTLPDTEVTLSAFEQAGRIRIEVRDHCGGLSGGHVEKLFEPFTQNGTNKSGMGLGLAICRRSVEANHGSLRAHNLPGSGCIFSIDLPRHHLGGARPDAFHRQTKTLL